TVLKVLKSVSHPVLTGIPLNELHVTSHLYKSRDLAATVTPLMSGHVEGRTESEPVAWVNTDQDRRVFYTSLGSLDDFKQPFFRRLLLNGVLWTLGHPVPNEVTQSSAGQPGSVPLSESPESGSERNRPPRQDHPLTPADSVARFKTPDDLDIDQVLAEPL